MYIADLVAWHHDTLTTLYSEPAMKTKKVIKTGPIPKEISVEDMQKIVDSNEKLVKDLKDDKD